MSKKPSWRDILNDSSIFETKINKGNYNLDASTLKLLPIILKALNSNLIFDNEIDDSNPKPVSYKTATNDDSYLQNPKTTFTNWFRTPSTIDYKPHYKNPTNLDYYSKIRKIRNYQKVLNLFDNMLNNKISMTSSEVMVEKLTDKPKTSIESKEHDKKEITYSTRHYSSQPRRLIMVRKVTQPLTNKRKTTTETQLHKMVIMKEKKCSCPKKLTILLNKIVHSIQEVLPELTLMVKVPCNDTDVNVTSILLTTSTPTTRRTSNIIEVPSIIHKEDDDITPTQLVTVSTVEPFTTITAKYPRSFINAKKPKKHLEVEPNNNIYLGVPMHKLNIKPIVKNMFNFEKQENIQKSSTKSKRKQIDAREILANSKLFTTPLITLPVHVTATTTSAKTTTPATITTSATTSAIITTSATTSATITTSATTSAKKTKFVKAIETTTDADILADDDEYYLKTPQEEATILSSSYLPQDLSDFNPYILELIKSNILRRRPKKEKFASKETNSYLNQVTEYSRIQQTNFNEESEEEFNINTPEQSLPSIEENFQLETKNTAANEMLLNSPNSINASRRIDHKHATSLSDQLSQKDRYLTLPSYEHNLIKSKYTTISFQETTKHYESRINTSKSPKKDNNFEINTSTATGNSDKIKVKKTVIHESTSNETNITGNDETNNNIFQELSPYEGLARKEGTLKGYSLRTYKNLAKQASSNDRKSYPLSNPKGETQKELNNYMNFLENVGHPVNVMISNWMTSVDSSSSQPQNSNFETPWYIKKKSSDSNEKSSIQTNNNNCSVLVNQINNQTQIVKAPSWSLDLITSPNCSNKQDDKIEIEMPDIENLMPVQEIPLNKYLGNPSLPEKLSRKMNKLPNEQFKFVDNSPSFLKSMLPHNRPIYLEIARRDWKKDVKEYDLSKETYTDTF